MTDVVYFVEGPGGLVKIGWSSNVARRLIALGRDEKAPLKLLATTAGTMTLERHLHSRFAADRVRGEWFRQSEALNRVIEQCAAGTFAFKGIARLPLSILFANSDRLISGADTIAILRPLLEEFIDFYQMSRPRMVAIDAVASRLGLSSEWVRKSVVGYGHRSVAADTFINIVAAYAELQREIQADAAHRANLSRQRQAEAERALAFQWGEPSSVDEGAARDPA